MVFPDVEKLGPRIISSYGLGTATNRQSASKVVVGVVLEGYDSDPELYQNAFAAHASDLYGDTNPPANAQEWRAFFDRKFISLFSHIDRPLTQSHH